MGERVSEENSFPVPLPRKVIWSVEGVNGRVKRISCHGLSLTGWGRSCQEAKGIGYEKLQHSIIVRTQIKDLLHKRVVQSHVKNKSMPNIFVNSERLRIGSM